MSDRYISVGSPISPNLNDVRGETGVTRHSTCSNART